MIELRAMSRFTRSVWLIIGATILFAFPMKMKAQGASLYGQALTSTGKPAAYATVRVCAYTGGGIPCTPLSSVYSDLALTQPVSNPYTTDQVGNYSVFVASGNAYLVQLTVAPGVVYAYQITAGGVGGGTVSSVGLTVPSGLLNVAGSPITGGGVFAVTLANQSANTAFLGPVSGGVAGPTFRALAAADITPAGTLTNNISGLAATASALAATPAQCASGSAPTGIAASGAAQNCTAYLQSGSVVTRVSAGTGLSVSPSGGTGNVTVSESFPFTSLTTSGTSGAASISAGGALNIPRYDQGGVQSLTLVYGLFNLGTATNPQLYNSLTNCQIGYLQTVPSACNFDATSSGGFPGAPFITATYQGGSEQILGGDTFGDVQLAAPNTLDLHSSNALTLSIGTATILRGDVNATPHIGGPNIIAPAVVFDSPFNAGATAHSVSLALKNADNSETEKAFWESATGTHPFAMHGVYGSVIKNAGGTDTSICLGDGSTSTGSGSCGSGGNTTSTSLTTNTLPKASGANSIVNSSLSDNGTTVSTSEPIAMGSGSTVNGSPICTTTTGCGGSGITALTGDVTASGSGSVAATLATVNSSPGVCGDATHVCAVTTNAKGLVTSQSPVAVTTTGVAGGDLGGTYPNPTVVSVADVTTGVLPIANGGTGAATASTARTALGLGTMATQNANAVAITGGTINGTPIGGTTPAAGAFTTPAVSDSTTNAATTAWYGSVRGAVQQVTQYAGSDISYQIRAAIAGNSGVGTVVDARGVQGGTITINPFTDLMNTGLKDSNVQLGFGVYNLKTQIIIPANSELSGQERGTYGAFGTTILADSSFVPAVGVSSVTRTGGTLVTIQTASAHNLVTNDEVFVYGTTGDPGPYGFDGVYQVVVVDSTHFTFTQQQSSTNGSGTANTGTVYIPMIVLGDIPTGGYAEGSRLKNMTVDCNGLSNCTGIMNFSANEQGGVENMTVKSSSQWGGWFVADVPQRSAGSGPPQNFFSHNLELFAPLGVNANCAYEFGYSGQHRGLEDMTCNSSGGSSGFITNGIVIDGAPGDYSKIHCEHTVNCVQLLKTYASTGTNGSIGAGIVLRAINGFVGVGNTVTVYGSGSHAPDNYTLEGIVAAGSTNILNDSTNSIVLPSSGDSTLAFQSVSTQNGATCIISSSPNVLINCPSKSSAASLSISGQAGLLSFAGLASTNLIKTVRNAADTLLELGGSYTPTGTWTNLTLATPKIGGNTISNVPVGTFNCQGAYNYGTGSYTGTTWCNVIFPYPVTVRRITGASSGNVTACSTYPVFTLTDNTTPINYTYVSGALQDSGALSQNYAANVPIRGFFSTAASGCSGSGTYIVTVAYSMQ